MRIIAPAMGTGQAAGLAASLAVERNLSPRELDGAENITSTLRGDMDTSATTKKKNAQLTATPHECREAL